MSAGARHETMVREAARILADRLEATARELGAVEYAKIEPKGDFYIGEFDPTSRGKVVDIRLGADRLVYSAFISAHKGGWEAQSHVFEWYGTRQAGTERDGGSNLTREQAIDFLVQGLKEAVNHPPHTRRDTPRTYRPGTRSTEASAQAIRAHAPRRARAHERRSYSMTYGVLPSFEKFVTDIRRIDPDEDRPFWPEGSDYPMELVDSHEIEMADDFGLERFTPRRYPHKSGFRAVDERTMYDFLKYLVDQFNEGDDQAGDFASSIMTTLGYEWI